jgi:hypothetical protein
MDGLTAFAWIKFGAAIDGVDPIIQGRLQLGDPPVRYLLDTLLFRRSESGKPITAIGLRSLPVDWVVSIVCLNFGLDNPSSGGVLAEGTVVDLDERDDAVKLRQRGLGDPDALKYVARTYVTQGLLGQPPVEWVATYFDCSLRTATRWVSAARKGGYLPAARTRSD